MKTFFFHWKFIKLYQRQIFIFRSWINRVRIETSNQNLSQAFSTPNTTFNLTVTELHSVIPLGRTAGALREGNLLMSNLFVKEYFRYLF